MGVIFTVDGIGDLLYQQTQSLNSAMVIESWFRKLSASFMVDSIRMLKIRSNAWSKITVQYEFNWLNDSGSNGKIKKKKIIKIKNFIFVTFFQKKKPKKNDSIQNRDYNALRQVNFSQIALFEWTKSQPFVLRLMLCLPKKNSMENNMSLWI